MTSALTIKNILDLSIICPITLYFMYISCTYHVHIMYIACTYYVHSMYISCTYHVHFIFILFIQNLYSALFTNKRALMRYSIIKSITQKAKI